MNADQRVMLDAADRVLQLYDMQYLVGKSDGGRVKHSMELLRRAVTTVRAQGKDEAPELGPEFFASAKLTRPGEDLI